MAATAKKPSSSEENYIRDSLGRSLRSLFDFPTKKAEDTKKKESTASPKKPASATTKSVDTLASTPESQEDRPTPTTTNSVVAIADVAQNLCNSKSEITTESVDAVAKIPQTPKPPEEKITTESVVVIANSDPATRNPPNSTTTESVVALAGSTTESVVALAPGTTESVVVIAPGTTESVDAVADGKTTQLQNASATTENVVPTASATTENVVPTASATTENVVDITDLSPEKIGELTMSILQDTMIKNAAKIILLYCLHRDKRLFSSISYQELQENLKMYPASIAKALKEIGSAGICTISSNRGSYTILEFNLPASATTDSVVPVRSSRSFRSLKRSTTYTTTESIVVIAEVLATLFLVGVKKDWFTQEILEKVTRYVDQGHIPRILLIGMYVSTYKNKRNPIGLFSKALDPNTVWYTALSEDDRRKVSAIFEGVKELNHSELEKFSEEERFKICAKLGIATYQGMFRAEQEELIKGRIEPAFAFAHEVLGVDREKTSWIR